MNKGGINQMNMIKKVAFVVFFIPLTAFSQVPKGDRVLAWQVDLPQSGNYDTAFSVAQTACMESIHLFFTWSDLQPDTATFDQVFIASFLDIINLYYPATGTDVELQFAVTNTVAEDVPAELSGLPFDDPLVISNFNRALDTLFAHIPAVSLSALNIGNESDIIFGTNAAKYAEFKNFLNAVIPKAKQLYQLTQGENLNVGTTITHTGLVDPLRANLCSQLNAGLDIVSVTYYPLAPDFSMRPVSDVGHDFSELVQLYSDTSQPIYFVECGYASSPTCNSSESQQADFYDEVFNAWDTLSDNIKYLTIFKTHDWSQATVDTLAVYYGINDSLFTEYLRTLGVLTWFGDGVPKEAYNRIQCNLTDRGWCPTVNCALGIVDTYQSSIKVYPNPSGGSFKVEIPGLSEAYYEVFRSNGKQVNSGNFNENMIEIEGLNSGIYFLKVFSKQGELLCWQKILVK